MLTSALVSKFIDVLAHTDVEDNPDFITVVNNAIDTTYAALNVEGDRPVCQSKAIVFTPDIALTPANSTATAPKKKRGWPKGKPRKPRPATSMPAVAPSAPVEETSSDSASND